MSFPYVFIFYHSLPCSNSLGYHSTSRHLWMLPNFVISQSFQITVSASDKIDTSWEVITVIWNDLKIQSLKKRIITWTESRLIFAVIAVPRSNKIFCDVKNASIHNSFPLDFQVRVNNPYLFYVTPNLQICMLEGIVVWWRNIWNALTA